MLLLQKPSRIETVDGQHPVAAAAWGGMRGT